LYFNINFGILVDTEIQTLENTEADDEIQMLENTEVAITNEQSRETGNIGYTRHKTKPKHNTIYVRHRYTQASTIPESNRKIAEKDGKSTPLKLLYIS
jgi:hypothetical protein